MSFFIEDGPAHAKKIKLPRLSMDVRVVLTFSTVLYAKRCSLYAVGQSGIRDALGALST